MKSIEDLILLFRKKGLKITPQRRAIFEILNKNGSHPNAEDIYKGLKKNMPDVSRTTVYNTLKELNNLGAISVVRNVEEGSIRYDPKTEKHDHLYCLQCSRIIDIENGNQEVELSKEKAQGFKIVDHQITYIGYCPDCQKTR